MQTRSVLSILVLGSALAACTSKPPSAPEAAPGAPASTADAATVAGGATPSVDVGERIYDGNCVPCHQQNGMGIPGVYPSLAGSPVVRGDPAELALWVLKGQRPASMPVGRYPTQMLQFGWMKPADAAALFSYLRANFGNSAPPVAAGAVAKALGQ
jgi:mono/diheme cytochrome c family protein